jgi:hypothetical protein
MVRISLLAVFIIVGLISIADSHAQSKEALFARDSVELSRELRRMQNDDQKYRRNSRVYKANYETVRKMDSVRTLRMIEIIETYGFPSMRRFASKDPIIPHLILVHAPRHFFDTLRPLLQAEKEAGRISSNEYAHILWHLDGRVGKPNLPGWSK